MSVLPKSVYRFNVISTEIKTFFSYLEKKNYPRMHMKSPEIPNSKATLNSNNKAAGIIMPDSERNFRAVVIKSGIDIDMYSTKQIRDPRND